jgi:predicted  nucleic acid-binding Zn-ribbon protein
MATLPDAEIQTILDQLANLNAQLTGKALLSDINTDMTAIRTLIETTASAITQLRSRVVNVQDTLDDLETRVRALE